MYFSAREYFFPSIRLNTTKKKKINFVNTALHYAINVQTKMFTMAICKKKKKKKLLIAFPHLHLNRITYRIRVKEFSISCAISV